MVFRAGGLLGMKWMGAVSGSPGFKASDFPPLATGKVRFVGEPIAMCLARNRAHAEDLAERVVVDLEELPALTDALAARRPGAPLVHEPWGDNLFMSTAIEGDIETIARTSPVVVTRE